MYRPTSPISRRGCRVNKSTLKVIIFFMFFSWCVIWIIIYYANCKLNPMTKLRKLLNENKEPEYLVNTSKCQIYNLYPFNEEAIQFYQPEIGDSCTNKPILTYITNSDNVITLHVNKSVISSYSTDDVVCCYFNITRKEFSEEPDSFIEASECKMFKENIILHHDVIYVKCFSKEERNVIYENTHATFMINDKIKKKMNNKHLKRQISVLLLGIDSVSRLNFIRSLPKTYDFVESNAWVPLKGYNGIDDNDLSNMISILTGRNTGEAIDICNPDWKAFDECPIIWNTYNELGYITSYAEDDCYRTTFNNKKIGFRKSPTDFYFRSYMLASEELEAIDEEEIMYCKELKTSGERILNLAKEFSVTFKKFPHMGLFWINNFSHQINTVSRMDDKIKDFLQEIKDEEVLENSVVVFFSNHGLKFGGIRQTETGWFEERLPFIYVSFPHWFKQKFPKEYDNFQINSARLTSSYDLHMTFQHILKLSGHNHEIKKSIGCPTCKSLFEVIDLERSCEEAGIKQHWCTCSRYEHIKLDEDLKTKITTYVLNEIYKIIFKYKEGWICSRYFVNNIISTGVSPTFPSTNGTYLLLKFETVPKAVYEATIKYEGDISDLNFSISSISRLDRYFSTSDCVDNEELKKYCFCLQSG